MNKGETGQPSDCLNVADDAKVKIVPGEEIQPEDSDVLVFGIDPKSGTSLQDAFKKYKSKRQKEIKKCRKRKDVPNEVQLRALANPDDMWALRMKFLEQIKKYFGVPYARKYWKPDEPEYSEKLFLDCCGLVRRAMRDLKKDFGFKIGPWNQCYMHDTLPLTIQEEDMKPGDLVFISAIFYNPKMKKQKHNLTHVEVWVGDGPKTIGARWHRDKVRVFDSYKFESTSYHTQKHIFKSIDTWLMGICRSHCPVHEWKTRAEKFKPTKRSIFSVKTQQDDNEDDEAASDTDANDTWQDRGKSAPLPQQRIKKKVQKPVPVNTKKPAVPQSIPNTPSGRTTAIEDIAESSEDDISIVEAETGSIARDLDEVRSPSPNLQRDFASRNPCEGKQTGSSQCRVKESNSSNKQACVASNEIIVPTAVRKCSAVDNEGTTEGNAGGKDSRKSNGVSQLQESQLSISTVVTSKDESASAFHVECQTGSKKGDIMHELSNENKWKGSNNVMCYSSVYKGEASVQIKSVDILSSDSSSGNDEFDEAGYLPEEQFCYSSSSSKPSNSPNNENPLDRPLSLLPPRRFEIPDDNSDSSGSGCDPEYRVPLSSSGSSSSKMASGENSGGAKTQRVSSAASQRSFLQPEVGLLYKRSDQHWESSTADSEQDVKGDNL